MSYEQNGKMKRHFDTAFVSEIWHYEDIIFPEL